MNHSPQVTVKKPCHTLSCKLSPQLALSSFPLSPPTILLPPTSPLFPVPTPLNCWPRCHVFACVVFSVWGPWSLSLLISLLLTLQWRNPASSSLWNLPWLLTSLSTTPSCWMVWCSFLDPRIGPHSQSYGFSGSHVHMWELDHREGWAPKNWCFWTVVLEKTLESLKLQGDPTSQS